MTQGGGIFGWGALGLIPGYIVTIAVHVRGRRDHRAARVRAVAGPLGARRGDRDPRRVDRAHRVHRALAGLHAEVPRLTGEPDGARDRGSLVAHLRRQHRVATPHDHGRHRGRGDRDHRAVPVHAVRSAAPRDRGRPRHRAPLRRSGQPALDARVRHVGRTGRARGRAPRAARRGRPQLRLHT